MTETAAGGTMRIPKPTDADKAYFHSLVPDDSRVEVKPMFGNLAAFVQGNMFLGLFGGDVGVRLGDADREQLIAEGGGGFGPPERPMKEYVALPAAWREERERAAVWVRRGLEHTATLPPKAAKS
jgi:TfoX/Sxy family transcriptional regulator of competence genes